MSILIKDMEMPTSCSSCKIKRRNGKKMICPLCSEEWDIRDPMSADHKLDNCPLVPVPPHGRCVDADKLIQEMRLFIKENMLSRDDARELLETIEAASTVLEAEEGE